MKQTGWFLISDGFVLCMRNGVETWTPDVKKGIPAGAMAFETEAKADSELCGMKSLGNWPLFTQEAKPIKKEW